MCGILGILSLESSEKIIAKTISSLKKLEYRGYDSWGYAFHNRDIKLEVFTRK